MNGEAVSYTVRHGVPYRHSRIEAHREHHAQSPIDGLFYLSSTILSDAERRWVAVSEIPG